MTTLDSSTEAARAGVRRAPILAALALAAACGGGGPSSLPDQPRIQLSKDHLTFEMFAYRPETLSPAFDTVRITNPSSTPLPGFPSRIDLTYLSGANWLGEAFFVDRPGYRIEVTPVNLEALDEGVYQARLNILWAGAANSPAAVPVELVVHPSTEMWRQGKPQVMAHRMGHAAVALPDGGALLVGGKDVPPFPSPAATLERLDARTGTWSSAGTLVTGRYFHTATLLDDGTVFIAGGEADAGPDPGATWELWDPADGSIVAHGALRQARFSHTAIRLFDGRVLLAGGAVLAEIEGVLQSEPTRRCEIFDPATRTLAEVGAIVGESATEGTAVLLPDHRVLITDVSATGSALGTELFDPDTGQWTAAHARQQLRSSHGLVGLPDGKVIAFGGINGTGMTSLRTAELYDAATDTWSPTGPLHLAHVLVGDGAVALPSGKALVAGGLLRVGTDAVSLFPTAAVETYDPATGTWTISSALPAPLALASVTVLADGTVMAAGGYPNLDVAAEFWREP